MALNRRNLPCSPEQVWSVLSDGRRYADWVVGTKRVRTVDASWPAIGLKFRHTVGVRPLYLHDETAVLECVAGERLVLEARFRPFGRARVEVRLKPSKLGSVVEMIEEPSSPAIARMTSPLWEPLIHIRNTEALRRLESTACRAA